MVEHVLHEANSHVMTIESACSQGISGRVCTKSYILVCRTVSEYCPVYSAMALDSRCVGWGCGGGETVDADGACTGRVFFDAIRLLCSSSTVALYYITYCLPFSAALYSLLDVRTVGNSRSQLRACGCRLGTLSGVNEPRSIKVPECAELSVK